jgi:hypothetical protein
MLASYYLYGPVPRCTYRLDGEGPNAEAMRLMAWVTAENGWKWRID